MSALSRAVRQMNFTGTNSPQVLGFAQQFVGIVGKPEVMAVSRWSVALGLTAYWFIEPDFSRFKPDEEESAAAPESE